MVFGIPRRTRKTRRSQREGLEFSCSLLRTPTRRLGERPLPLSTDASPVRAGFVRAASVIRSSSQAGKNAGTPPHSPAAALATSQARLSAGHADGLAADWTAEPRPGRLPAAQLGEHGRGIRRRRERTGLADPSGGTRAARPPGRRAAPLSELRRPARGFVPATGGCRAARRARDE